MKNILTLIGLMILSGCSTSPITHGIPNLALVEPGVWRGGQPNAEGWEWLKSQGVTYDVKLNTWNEASDAKAFTNGIFVQDDGMIDFAHQTIAEPNGYALACAVQSLQNHSGTIGVFVHCEHGQDRTGLVVALYRVRFENWSKPEAEKEMLAHGFHKSLRGLWNYWEDFSQ